MQVCPLAHPPADSHPFDITAKSLTVPCAPPAVITIQRAFRKLKALRPVLKLHWRQRVGLFMFAGVSGMLAFIGIVFSAFIYDVLIMKQPDSVSNYILLAMMLFLAVISLAGLHGAFNKSMSWLRFYSFMLLVEISMQLAALLVPPPNMHSRAARLPLIADMITSCARMSVGHNGQQQPGFVEVSARRDRRVSSRPLHIQVSG